MVAATLSVGSDLLGLKQKSPIALHDAVLDGLPYSALVRFIRESGLPATTVYDALHIPPRTLARRKHSGQLSREESGHLQRLAKLFKTTVEFFGNHRSDAVDWLMTKRPVLGNRQPIDLAKTEVGTEQVEILLFQLSNGILV